MRLRQLPRNILQGLLLMGGTVSFITGCGIEPLGDPPPRDRFYYPMSLQAHPEGRYLYVTNATFDRQYRGGTVTVVDSWERRVIPEATVEIGLFSGELSLSRAPCPTAKNGIRCEGDTVAYTTSRDQSSLIQLLIDDQASPGEMLRCDERGSARRCGERALRSNAQGRPLFEAPFSIALDEQGLFLTHINSGALSRWGFPADPTREAPQFRCQTRLSQGSGFIARHPKLPLLYLTSPFDTSLSVLRETIRGSEGLCRLETTKRVPVGSPVAFGERRGLAFSASGERLYVASSAERALRIFDTRGDGAGGARDRLVATVPLGSEPSLIRVAGLRAGESPARPARGVAEAVLHQRGEGLIYVSLFSERRIVVIDPLLHQIITEIKLPGTPYDIAFLPDSVGRLKAFVTTFEEHSVIEIDVEPGSRARFQPLTVIR